MTITLRRLGMAVCLGLMTTLVGCASTSESKRETAGQYLDDSVITSKVKAAIFDEPTLKTLQITVNTYQGNVQLSGFVDSADAARRAGDVARRVDGVRSVRNDLVVK